MLLTVVPVDIAMTSTSSHHELLHTVFHDKTFVSLFQDYIFSPPSRSPHDPRWGWFLPPFGADCTANLNACLRFLHCPGDWHSLRSIIFLWLVVHGWFWVCVGRMGVWVQAEKHFREGREWWHKLRGRVTKPSWVVVSIPTWRLSHVFKTRKMPW